jgi:hypothetical protein
MSVFPRFLLFVLSLSPLPAAACSGSVHVELEEAGVYAIDHAAITAAQPLLADCRSADLALTWRGREVPIRVVDGGDGRFGDGDRIEWVGRRLHGPESWYDAYSVDNVYLLRASPGTHARIRDASAGGDGSAALERRLHIEQENLLIRLDQQQQQPGEEPDVWQWAKLSPFDPKPFSVRFDLPDFVARGEAVVTLNFRGLSTVSLPFRHTGDKPDDHEVIARVNGHALAPLAWNGRDEIRREIRIPVSLLRSAGNTLDLSVPRRAIPWGKAGENLVDVVMFNWMEWRYPLGGAFTAGAEAFTVAGSAAATVRLSRRDGNGGGAPVLYGADGVRRPGTATAAGHYVFAAAAPGVELFAVEDGGALRRPVAIRAAAPWQDPAQGYDYLIVSHASLIDAIAPLADFHRQRGLRVGVFDVAALYDAFNDGIPHPRAIRNFVQHAWNDWPGPKPRFLLLVGKASFDIRHATYDDSTYAKFADYQPEIAVPGGFMEVPGTPYAQQPAHLADSNLVPTWQFPSPEGQSASDNPFGTIGDDWHPKVAVGRFPVVRPDEVAAIVDKTLRYFREPRLGEWRRDVMFITDESEAFKRASDEIAGSLGDEGFAADKVYASKDEADNLAHQAAIREGLQEGRLLVHFIGHGGRYIWRTGPPDLRKNHDLFTLDDVASLSNGDRLPVILSMTCYSAPFDNPSEDSIGERFLREPGRGAVAVFAASWRNSPSPEFSKSLIGEMLAPGATIGEAIVRAKASITSRTLVEMYNLLGDPAIVLERPRDEAKLAFDGDRWSPYLALRLPEARFRGNLHVDWLGADGATLAKADYAVAQPALRLPIPSIDGSRPSGARIYAASMNSGRDAIAAIDLTPDALPAPHSLLHALAERWREWTRPAYVPRPLTADTLFRGEFDTSAAAAARPEPAQDAAP